VLQIVEKGMASMRVPAEKQLPETIVTVGRESSHGKGLLTSGALQEAILRSARFSSIATDAEGVIQIFNVGAERMLGYAASDVVNALTPADLSDSQELIARADALSLELGTPVTPGFEALVCKARRGIEDIYELTYTCKDGRRLPAIVSVTALRDAKDAIIGYLLISTDNSVRKETENARAQLDQRFRDQQLDHNSNLEREVQARTADLRASEQRFRDMANSIRDIFVLIDADSDALLYVSPAYEQIVGRSCESLYANHQTWLDAIHPDDRASIRKKYVEGVRRGHFQYEYRIVRPDGAIRVLGVRGFAVRDDAGNVVRIAGVGEDITERKQAAEELRESDRRFSNLLDNVELAAVMLDREARITYVNDHLLHLTGWRREEVVGQDYFELFVPPEDSDTKIVFAALLDDLPEAWHHENYILTRSGERKLIRWNNSILKSAAGNVVGTASLGEDITERKRSENQIRHLNRVHAVLSGINNLILRVHDRQELFTESCRIAVEHGNFAGAWIGLLDPVTLDVTPVAWVGEIGEVVARKRSAREDVREGQGPVGRAIRERRPAFSNDISTHGHHESLMKDIRGLHFRSKIALPLIDEQTVVGVLVLYAGDRNFFDAEEVRLLTGLAADISFALLNIGRQKKLDKLARIRAVSSGVNAAINRIHDRGALLQRTCEIAVEHGKFELAWVALIDQEKLQVQPVGWAGFPPEFAHEMTWAGLSSRGLMLPEVIGTRKVAMRDDLQAETTAGPLVREAIRQGHGSAVCVPFMVDRRVVGAMFLFAPGRAFFDEQELALLQGVAEDVSFALQTISKQEQLDYLSYYDVLTGLANRALFHQRLAQSVVDSGGHGGKVALILLDVERFKTINDTLGRHAGDALLKELASRLRGGADVSRLARIDADHFAVLIPDFQTEEDLARLIEHLTRVVFETPFLLGDTELRISAKLGIAIFPGDGADADTLFRNAEAAIKKAKASGERYLFYAQSMNERVAENLSLENKLRQAIEKEEFILHYQPKLDLRTGKLAGVEALIRWNDPQAGMVPPNRFIPVLEQTGLIHEVGRWVLRTAVAEHLRWRARDPDAARIAVNVSPIQLRSRGFEAEVRQAIGPEPGAAAGLELEITESLIMEDVKHSIASLQAIRALGVTIAIDDFGTGFSSLGYLAKLPVDALKIDRSFVNEMTATPEGLSLVSTIITLAHALNLRVVAEGVETEEQLKLLRLLNCDEIQGFLYCRPMTSEAFTAKYLAPGLAAVADGGDIAA
jgi:diguanylate cyclase (GGDEF)-like protein/PAS domain S-box-containing protein